MLIVLVGIASSTSGVHRPVPAAAGADLPPAAAHRAGRDAAPDPGRGWQAGARHDARARRHRARCSTSAATPRTSRPACQRMAAVFPDHALYLLHYPGYGGAPGRPSEAALVARRFRPVRPGGRAASETHGDRPQPRQRRRDQMASARRVERLVLVTAYDSVEELAARPFHRISGRTGSCATSSSAGRYAVKDDGADGGHGAAQATTRWCRGTARTGCSAVSSLRGCGHGFGCRERRGARTSPTAIREISCTAAAAGTER